MSVPFSLARASRWLLDSGIQEPLGGVARYYRSEIGKNKPVSTEITGYHTSALVYLFEISADEKYLDRARKTVCFLLDHAWNEQLRTFPFEHPSPSPESHHHSYFFDCGIIIRGLLAVWRHTREPKLLEVATQAAQSMIADFHAGPDYHPILDLPAKQPLPRTEHWSRTSGCYQLKAQLAWWEVGEAAGDKFLQEAYLDVVAAALATHAGYLQAAVNEHQVMDRLHPYAYFLEGLTPLLHRPDCAEAYLQAMSSISLRLNAIAPSFARSDVYAQLLRARIFGAETLGIDRAAAAAEAEALIAYQAVSEDPRIDGGFSFGQRHGEMSPHVNPVSTVFALQALEMWSEFQASAESKPPCHQMLI
jgi:hypothetical protein